MYSTKMDRKVFESKQEIKAPVVNYVENNHPKCASCIQDVKEFEVVCADCYDDFTVKKNFDEFRAIMLVLNRKMEQLLKDLDAKNNELEKLKQKPDESPKQSKQKKIPLKLPKKEISKKKPKASDSDSENSD